jgi:hypothetical protein
LVTANPNFSLANNPAEDLGINTEMKETTGLL